MLVKPNDIWLKSKGKCQKLSVIHDGHGLEILVDLLYQFPCLLPDPEILKSLSLPLQTLCLLYS